MKDSDQKLVNTLKEEIHDLKIQLKEYERNELAIEAAGFDVWENNFVTGKTSGTNKRLFTSLGYGPEELPNDLTATFEKIHPEDLKNALKLANEHFDGETEKYQAEMRIKAKDGSWVWIGSYGRVMERDDDNRVTRFVGMTINIDKRRILDEAIKELAYIDTLTKLSNRRGLFETGNFEIERSRRFKHPVSMLMLDIDDFKRINDNYGHLKGDDILIEVSNVINEIIRDIDLKVRYGGDEFVIILLETNQKQAFETAERLRKHIHEYNFDLPESLTVSIGISDLRDHDTLEDLIERSDQSLYKSKGLGKNITTIF